MLSAIARRLVPAGTFRVEPSGSVTVTVSARASIVSCSPKMKNAGFPAL